MTGSLDSEQQQLKRLEKRLLSQVGRASAEYGLLEPDDRVMVALSGGKDSYAMLHLLERLRQKAPFSFSLVAVNLDQKQPGFPEAVLPNYLRENGYDFRIIEEDTYSIVKEKIPEGKTYCALCSRLRRGILYNVAEQLGATKIALGHHRDDTIETLLLNLLYSGQIKAMPAKLVSDDRRNVVIRPLILCAENEIAEFAELMRFPIIPCNLCGSQDNLKRQRVKELLAELTQENANVPGNLLAALGNVRTTHLLDRSLLTGDLGGDTSGDSASTVSAPEREVASRPASDQGTINRQNNIPSRENPPGNLIPLTRLLDSAPDETRRPREEPPS